MCVILITCCDAAALVGQKMPIIGAETLGRAVITFDQKLNKEIVFTLVTDCCGYTIHGVQFKAFHTKPSHTRLHRIDQTKFTTLTNFHILDLTEVHNFDQI